MILQNPVRADFQPLIADTRNMNVSFDKLTTNVFKYIRDAYAILETQDLERAKLIHDRRGNEG